MIAAIYGRKSTEQHVPEELRSVSRQIDNARVFAAAKGWTVDDEHIFVDDGISGAEFERRPGLQRLLSAVRPRAPFQVLIVEEQKALGRELLETGYLIKKLGQAGVEVWESKDRGRLLTPRNAMEKATFSLRGFGDEKHREDSAYRTKEAHTRRAQKGYVVGGRVFGYNNVDVIAGTDASGRPIRSHVERRIHPGEAAVVREIFELAAAGKGIRAIAHHLNAKGVATPRAQRGRPNGWDMGTVRAILLRPIYRGVVVWNKTQKRDAWGQKNQRLRPESEWLTVDVPELRIVSDKVFEAASTQRVKRTKIGPNGKRGVGGRPAKYLLTGLIRCACGAKFEARGPLGIYVCAARVRKGPAVCSNDLTFAIKELDQLALDCIEGKVLSESFVDRIVSTLPASTDNQREAIEREVRDAEQAVGNLVALAKTGCADIPALAAEIVAANAHLNALRRRQASLPQGQQDRETLRAAMLQQVEHWRTVLRQYPAQAREVVKEIIGEVRLTDDLDINAENEAWLAANGKKTKGLEAEINADAFYYKCLASPTGFEPVFWP